MLRVQDSNGKFVKARALLDTGSEVCLISSSLTQKLGLKVEQTGVSLKGLGGTVQLAHRSMLLEFG